MDETAFRVELSCPTCAGTVSLESADRACLCPFCGSAHWVLGRPGPIAFVVPNRIADDEEALDALIEDWRRSRGIELALSAEGRAGRKLDPLGEEASRRASTALDLLLPRNLSPSSNLPEAILEADLAAWAAGIRREIRLLERRFFHAPYWHLALRLYEGVVGRDGAGTKKAAVAVRGAELSRNAFDDALPLPGMGKLSYCRILRPLPLEARERFAHLEPVNPSSRLDPSADQMAGARIARELVPIARRLELWKRERHVVFRPFHLIRFALRGKEVRALVDGASRSCVATLSAEEEAAVAQAIRPSLPPEIGTPLALRPMKCPVCAGALPLDRPGEVRFCTNCYRAIRVDGERLVAIPHDVELVEEPERSTIHLPFWRFEFSIVDPRDGREIRTIASLRERLGGRPTIRPARSRRSDRFDVPAFRPLDARRAIEIYQLLFALSRRPEEQLIPGPVRPESGFRPPERPVAIGPDEASFVARQALLLRLDEHDLSNASPSRIKTLLFDLPLGLSSPRLVLRAFRRLDVTPIAEPLGVGSHSG
jgi:hypothetical protein